MLSDSQRECIQNYTRPDDGEKWCEAVWDFVLCWPPTRAGMNASQQCPPLKGLDSTLTITKVCHPSGRWQGRNESDFHKDYGWTNFTPCFTKEVHSLMGYMKDQELSRVSNIVKILEFAGYSISVLALIIVIGLYIWARKLEFPKYTNVFHLHTMFAMLIVALIKFELFLEFLIGVHDFWLMEIVCQSRLFILELGRLSVALWIFSEVFFSHNKIAWEWTKKDPLWSYFLTGYGVSLFQALIWIFCLWKSYRYSMPFCLGDYKRSLTAKYLSHPKIFLLAFSLLMLANIGRVLWCKYANYTSSIEHQRIKRHTLIATLLFFLIALPDIIHETNVLSSDHIVIQMIAYFNWILVALQGLIGAIIFIFFNKEAIKRGN